MQDHAQPADDVLGLPLLAVHELLEEARHGEVLQMELIELEGMIYKGPKFVSWNFLCDLIAKAIDFGSACCFMHLLTLSSEMFLFSRLSSQPQEFFFIPYIHNL